MFKSTFSIILVCIPAFLSSFFSAAEKVTLGVLLSSGTQRTTISSLVEEFEAKEPGIEVEIIFKLDAEYKEELNKWFREESGPDILNWQGGERLYQYVRQGKVKNLQQMWLQEGLSETFSPASISAVSLNNQVYAIPISYYQWGFYYRKSVFNKLNLQAPTTWNEFLNVSARLKSEGIAPITIGTKYKWPTAAWFDYLNLRVNGLDFHLALLQGKESYLDPRVTKVLNRWKELLDKGFFLEQSNGRNWQQAMPFMYHKYAGMTLIGNFFTGVLPPEIKNDFQYFKFPIVDESVPMYEEAPLDLFMVPSYARLTESSRKLLMFFASRRFQETFNETMGMIPPNMNTKRSADPFINKGTATLNEAVGVSQFFDRDTSAEMSAVAMDVFAEFMSDKDILKAQRALENARKEHL